MTGNSWLDWALIAISLHNTIIMLWLGLTVLLNADRRVWGIWLMGGGLLLAAAFFISHTAILGHDLANSFQGANLWWLIGWVPALATPFSWYVMMLWYSGFWSPQQTGLRRRHRWWLALVAALGISLVGLITFTHTLPSFYEVAVLDLSSSPTVAGIPVLFALFPAFIVLCIGLSLDALRNPNPSERMMGELARQRTHPWLVATATILLVVSLLVAWFLVRVLLASQASAPGEVPISIMEDAIWFDLGIETLIALAATFLGQGIVAYEVFTGKVLPRRGFSRHWRSAVILAIGYAVVASGSVVVHLPPVYMLVLTSVVITVFYALVSWRSFVERERFVAQLRPFVSPQNIVQHLMSASLSAQDRAHTMFQALCRDVLSAQAGLLIPLGPLAPLAGPPLGFPDGAQVAATPSLPGLSGGDEVVTLAASFAPFRWAVPLWADRGLIGALLLGEKQDRSLYTQEEIAVARTSGERMIDLLAGEEMARRLMALQRRRLAETQVLDRRTRRALHDEVLPDLHAAILRLGSLPERTPAVEEAIHVLTGMHRQISGLIRISPAVLLDQSNSGAFAHVLQAAIETEFQGEFDSIQWDLSQQTPPLDPLAAEVLFYATREAVRNAALHARGSGGADRLELAISLTCDDRLTIQVSDNGIGMPPERDGGNSRTGGLTLHATLVAVIGGSLEVIGLSPTGTRVAISAPLPAQRPSAPASEQHAK